MKSLEDARDLTAAIPDGEFLPKDAGDPIASPDRARETIRLGAMPEEIGEQADLLGSELKARSGARMSAEGIALPRPCGGHPLTDSTLTDAENCGDLALSTTLLLEIQRPHSPPLPPVVISRAWSLHARIIGAKSLVFHATLSKCRGRLLDIEAKTEGMEN